MRAGASPCTPAVPPTLCRAHLRGVCSVRRARQAASGATHLMGTHAKLGWAPAAQASHTKADSTLRSSRAVPHPSTNRALRRLTSEVRRDPVHSARYGRQREFAKCKSSWPRTHTSAPGPTRAEVWPFERLHPECGERESCGRTPHARAGASPTGACRARQPTQKLTAP